MPAEPITCNVWFCVMYLLCYTRPIRAIYLSHRQDIWEAVAVIKYTYVVDAFISEKRSKDERN